MGRRIWLPIGSRNEPYPNPQTRRQELLNRLWHTGTLLPGSRTMPLEMLTDYVQSQEAKMRIDVANQAKIPKQVMSQQEYEQVRGAIKEYLNWKRRKEGR